MLFSSNLPKMQAVKRGVLADQQSSPVKFVLFDQVGGGRFRPTHAAERRATMWCDAPRRTLLRVACHAGSCSGGGQVAPEKDGRMTSAQNVLWEKLHKLCDFVLASGIFGNILRFHTSHHLWSSPSAVFADKIVSLFVQLLRGHTL